MAKESRKRDTEETGRQPPQGPVLCANGCGFFGSASTANLCSKCYADLVLKEAKATSTSTKAAAEKALLTTTQALKTLGLGLATASEPSVAVDANAQGQASNRCFSCKKRVGLTGFKCRCGYVFCSTHRYSDAHDCSFDYKTAGRDAIAKANPVVKADKVQKIRSATLLVAKSRERCPHF